MPRPGGQGDRAAPRLLPRAPGGPGPGPRCPARPTGRSARLLNVGKAYTGLTDAEIATLTEYFLDHTLEVKGRFRSVEPRLVIEVAFDRIQSSARHASGYALRFPRIVRLRNDKGVAEIDTLETCRKLAGALVEAESAPQP